MIRGTKRNLSKNKATVDLDVKIHNRFDIEVVDAKTGTVKQRAKAENVILNRWWDELSSSAKVYNIAFGSGSGSPSASDTDLFARIGYARFESTTFNKIDKVNHVTSKTHHISLTETQYVGSTFTEVGLANSSGKLVTHAMIQDMNGNPISILKTDADILNIYATVFAHWQPTYCDGAVVVSAEAYEGNSLFNFLCGSTLSGNVFYRTHDCGVTTGTIPSGTGTSVTKTYDPVNRSVHIKANRVPVDAWNVENGIPVLYFGSGVNGGTTAHPKSWTFTDLTFYPDGFLGDTNVIGESIGTGDGSTADFKTKFSPAYDVDVLVDGVPAFGVSVGENLPAYGGNIGRSFRFLPLESETQPLPESSAAERKAHGVFSDTSGSTSVVLRGAYYNPYYQHGVVRLENDSLPSSKPVITVDVSDDLKSWTTVFNATAQKTIEIPEEYQNSKYWATNYAFKRAVSRDIPDTNIHFLTPPAEGSVITANYKTTCLPKDENHVFDFEFTIYVGEYET